MSWVPYDWLCTDRSDRNCPQSSGSSGIKGGVKTSLQGKFEIHTEVTTIPGKNSRDTLLFGGDFELRAPTPQLQCWKPMLMS